MSINRRKNTIAGQESGEREDTRIEVEGFIHSWPRV